MTTNTTHIAVKFRDGTERAFSSAEGDLSLTTYGPFVTIVTADEHVYLPQEDVAMIVAKAPTRGRS